MYASIARLVPDAGEDLLTPTDPVIDRGRPSCDNHAYCEEGVCLVVQLTSLARMNQCTFQ